MDFNYTTCFYEGKPGLISGNVSLSSLTKLKFEPVIICGEIQELLNYLSNNKVDIVIINVKSLNYDRICFALNIIYKNFCKNIIIISDEKLYQNRGVKYLSVSNLSNFDLELEMKLMDIRREIELCPSKNLSVLKLKVSNMLNEFQFSSRHDGFKYYIDAIILAYMKQPYDYSTMQLYKEVGEKYGKSFYAVEKSMRMALIYAFNRLKSAPNTDEYNKLRSQLTYDLNNNTCISMFLNRLIRDAEIIEDLIEQKQFLYMR